MLSQITSSPSPDADLRSRPFHSIQQGDFFHFDKLQSLGICRKVGPEKRQNQDGNLVDTDRTARVILLNVEILWSVA